MLLVLKICQAPVSFSTARIIRLLLGCSLDCWFGAALILFSCRQPCTKLTVAFSSPQQTQKVKQDTNTGMEVIINCPSRSQRKEFTLSTALYSPLFFLYSLCLLTGPC